MKQITTLASTDVLPLTCSRTGSCCFGNQVLLNPWELALIAHAKKITAREFSKLYCDLGGIRLRFDADLISNKKRACRQYIDNFGCSVYEGRPLACRLFPLGRYIQNNEAHYMYEGTQFPCMAECPEVTTLPSMTVSDYLSGQETALFENAVDAYLDMVQNIADIAFALLLDTGLSESGETQTLQVWRQLSDKSPNQLSDEIPQEWFDHLLFPEIEMNTTDPLSFINEHNEFLQIKVQEAFGALETMEQLHKASVLIMRLALYLACSIGANSKELAELWIEIAKSNGAQE